MTLDMKKRISNSIKSLIIPLLIFSLFAILSGGRTASGRMLMTTLRQSVVPIIICWGLMMNMTVGMMNFSAGGMVLCAGIVGGNMARSMGTGIIGLVVFCMLISVLLGAATGLIYNMIWVPCMVLTIGTMLIWESLPRVFYSGGVTLRPAMTYLSRSPYCFIILGILLVFFHFVFNQTVFGHNLRAIGNNQSIAISVGVQNDKIKFLSFLYGGIFLGAAAFLYVSENGEVRNVIALGSMSIMMDGFMGLFIAMFLSKYCNMSVAVVIGAFSMKMITNGFVAIGLSSTVRDIVQGAFLLLLLIISANSGFFEKRREDRAFANQANLEFNQHTDELTID